MATRYIIVALFKKKIALEGYTTLLSHTEIKAHDTAIIAKPVDNKTYKVRAVAEKNVPRESPIDDAGFIGYRIDEIFLSAKQIVLLKFPTAELFKGEGAIKKYRIHEDATNRNLSGYYHTELDAWESVIKNHITKQS